MKIEMNTLYRFETKEHYDDFLAKAILNGSERAKTPLGYIKDRMVFVYNDGEIVYALGKGNRSVIEWKLGFTKADMQEGQLYKTRDGEVYLWCKDDENSYDDNLYYSEFPSLGNCNDITEVYPMNLTPIWKRSEPKYRVKTELTKEQAEKLGLELCEEVTE